ncbi:nucleoside recognition domain-containing protein [Carboxydothermus pertinax]|uniref:Nucleoside recognition protein n=1 Tax=Carboxydothermus pertinax TaxID=870242 RepID=A0A1L8CTT8_9THEO|nr:nucleoside recognition domain-containing protein [Carboxydothermus pertinax]GAV22317.1 nucleoside recognition protein [Carboxydothermus pertinax]
MLNYLWGGMMVLGCLAAFWQGKPELIIKASLDGAKLAVDTAFSLISIITFWLGIMKIMEETGVVAKLAHALAPLIRWLFPEVPPGHPAEGAILLNLSANILGLGNAATPFGLKAMEELSHLNPQKDTASRAMCTFLALNTSAITLLPTTIIGLRQNFGSKNPTDIIIPTFLATLLGFSAALIADYLFKKSRW